MRSRHRKEVTVCFTHKLDLCIKSSLRLRAGFAAFSALSFCSEINLDSTNGFQPSLNRAALRLNAKKLLLTKWTAAKPQNKEKHFIVTRLIEPDVPDAQIEMIELEATYSKRSFTLPWRDLKDETQWLQGWK